VHREQIPSGFFFDPKSAESLARVLSQAWVGLQAGPRLFVEKKALGITRVAAEHYGVACQKICEEAKAEWQNRIQERLKIIKNSPYFNVSQVGELWIVVGELLRLVNRGCSVPGNPTLSPISLEAFEKTLPIRVVASRGLWAKIGRTLSILPQNFHS
jgi:hypothetical protein